MSQTLEQHNVEIHEGLRLWNRKPLLQKVYHGFYREILKWIQNPDSGLTVELGSGIGNLKSVLPQSLATDLFPNPWIDRVETAYNLSFDGESVQNLILFDVFHHLRYPGTALNEFHRVLKPGGRLIIFEPSISLLGKIVYGPLHHEPIGMKDSILWHAPEEWDSTRDTYYAAQGNATRIFILGEHKDQFAGWKIQAIKRFSAVSYIGTGGFRGPQLYPKFMYPIIVFLDKFLDWMPALFSTRQLIVMEKESLIT